MIRTLVLLCLAVPAFSWWDSEWKKGLKVRYDVNPIAMLTGESFIDLPQSKDSAVNKGWTEASRPDLHEEFSSLEVWCLGRSSVCLLFDDTGYIAGLLIAFNTNEFTDVRYDWKTQGFRDWVKTNKDGESEDYKFTALYFSCPEYLERSAEDRIATRDSKKLLQHTHICVSGINGELHRISTNVSEIADTATSNFTLQACMPGMGTHYYYEMTEKLACNDQLFPWFPLVFDELLVGIGFVAYGKHSPSKNVKNYFEKPPRAAVKLIVPRGPECLYDLADAPGLITMHTYFIDKPTSMLCLPKIW